MNVDGRLKFIEELDSFIDEKRKLLAGVLNKIGWTEESLESEGKVQCPVNSGHWIPESSLNEHIEMCAWTKEGYLKEEKDMQTPSSKFFYRNSTSVVPVIIDKEVQASIISECSNGVQEKRCKEELPDIPLTMDRSTVEMTPQQRLAIYDYVVNSGKAVNKPNNVKMEDLLFDFEKKNENEDKPKSHLEVLAEQRDYKRRRQSYRAKNVHITKKSYTEVMKEVIENQITYLAETRKQEDAERDGEDSANSSITNATEPKEKRVPEDSEIPHETREVPRHHRSRRSCSDSGSPERSRHKHRKSRSRSRTRHKHKKSHHKKHKKSH